MATMCIDNIQVIVHDTENRPIDLNSIKTYIKTRLATPIVIHQRNGEHFYRFATEDDVLQADKFTKMPITVNQTQCTLYLDEGIRKNNITEQDIDIATSFWTEPVHVKFHNGCQWIDD